MVALTGAILTTLPTKGRIFSQPVFAQGTLLFVATQTGGLYDFALGS